MSVRVRADIQLAVDQYLELYSVYKQLEKKIDELRKVIEPYMKENGLDHVANSDGTGRVQLTLAERPIMTSRYTTYDADEICSLLNASVWKKCVVEVVDKEKLEALAKMGEVPEEVLAHKVTKPSYSMVVRYEK
jgi:hypothetical protein